MNQPKHALMGFSEIEITPEDPTSCQLIGFYRPDNRVKGILHPLKAQVLILTDTQRKCCIITIDSIGFTVELTGHLRDQVAEKLQLSQEEVMVCFSHTHAAPDAAASNCRYFYFVLDQVIKAAEIASLDLIPIKAVWGIAENTIAVNRRTGAEAIDQRIGVLKIAEAHSGQVRLMLLRVTAHANILTSDNYFISSDFFGVTRELMEKQYGCKTMITQGASGDIKSKYRQKNADFLEEHAFAAAQREIDEDEDEKKKDRDESLAALAKNAARIYDAIDAIWESLVPQPVDRLAMFSHRQTFFADVPPMERALAIAGEARSEAGIDGTGWLQEVARLHEQGIARQEVTKEIQYFSLNDGCLCGIGDEPMCEIAIDIQRKTRNPLVFFGGYTNGYDGYLPTAEEYDRGGYEVLWSYLIYYPHCHRVMPLNRETARDLADHISKTLAEHR